MASRGYIVAAMGELQMKAFDRKETGTPQSALPEGPDRLLQLWRDRKSVFALTADTTLIAAAGHSCGGAQQSSNGG